ncbi:MAG: hypothetical protein D6731_07680 [Planctomycetota bacterium]|nr:MAG: hypothetical protein D6731_07680 [Planctomycetota bacterium]
MSLTRWGLAPVLTALLVGIADAGDLDRRLAERPAAGTLLQVADADLGLDSVPLADLSPVADFHPETDRWTERNNRIKLSAWGGVWAPSGELDIDPSLAIGLRLAWEVPGFIGIHIEGGAMPVSRLEVKSGPNNSEDIGGLFHSYSVGLAIFNPELSVDGLAFWAGFGGSLWLYNFSESDVFVTGDKYEFNDSNIGGFIFIELDYEIVDVFHIGLSLRQHVLLADHTNDGRFYEVNGVSASNNLDRNEGPFDDLASVFEARINISILF